jgi:hypothetical protein
MNAFAPSSSSGTATFQYKYTTHWSIYPDCPPAGLQSVGTNFYRVVHADLHHVSNFQPPAVISPARLSTWAPKKCCESYALSVFDSLDNLSSFVRLLKKSTPNISKLLGDHYCEFPVTTGDGRISACDHKGHINFYEFVSFNAALAVTKHAVLL